MSRVLGNELPPRLVELLDGHDLASKWGHTIPLVTVDGNGFPHFAVLSYGEIKAHSTTEIRLGTYPNSSTSRNMKERPPIGLLIVDGDSIYYIKGSAREHQAS